MKYKAAKENPAQIAIFGATGNLARLKLFPALYILDSQTKLHSQTKITGVSRRQWSDEDFQEEVKQILQQSKMVDFDEESEQWKRFSKRLQFVLLDFKDEETFANLSQRLAANDKNTHLPQSKGFNRYIYLSVSPSFYANIAKNLHKYEIIETGHPQQQIAVEKPFGFDLASAKDFSSVFSENYSEEQVKKVDHVINKESIDDVFSLRKQNEIFNHILNSQFVDHIQITYSEDIGIQDRGSFYEQVGALRDMVQSHILEALALVLSDWRKANEDDIHRARSDVLASLQFQANDIVIGQYSRNEEMEYKGYRQEDDVAEDSTTETFVALKLTANYSHWQNLPIYIRTGKRLQSKYFDIHIVFRNGDNLVSQNAITFRISPYTAVNVRLWHQREVSEESVEPMDLSYCYRPEQIRDAYAKVFERLLIGENAYYVSDEELFASWRLIDKIRERYRDIQLHSYEAGSRGPQQADALIENDDRKWLDRSISDVCKFR